MKPKEIFNLIWIGSSNDAAEINFRNDTLVILDEIHVLQNPPKTDFLPTQISGMKRSRFRHRRSCRAVWWDSSSARPITFTTWSRQRPSSAGFVGYPSGAPSSSAHSASSSARKTFSRIARLLSRVLCQNGDARGNRLGFVEEIAATRYESDGRIAYCSAESNRTPAATDKCHVTKCEKPLA